MKRIAILAIACCALASTGTATASPGPSPKPMQVEDPGGGGDGEYIGWGDEGEYLTYSGGTSSCRVVWARRNWDSILGFNLWRYYEQVNWCYSGGVITSLHRYRWPEVNAIPWSFDGNVATNCNQNEDCSGRTGISSTTVWTEGQFHACFLPLGGLCKYLYPVVSITVNGYGGHTSYTSN